MEERKKGGGVVLDVIRGGGEGGKMFEREKRGGRGMRRVNNGH